MMACFLIQIFLRTAVQLAALLEAHLRGPPGGGREGGAQRWGNVTLDLVSLTKLNLMSRPSHCPVFDHALWAVKHRPGNVVKSDPLLWRERLSHKTALDLHTFITALTITLHYRDQVWMQEQLCPHSTWCSGADSYPGGKETHWARTNPTCLDSWFWSRISAVLQEPGSSSFQKESFGSWFAGVWAKHSDPLHPRSWESWNGVCGFDWKMAGGGWSGEVHFAWSQPGWVSSLCLCHELPIKSEASYSCGPVGTPCSPNQRGDQTEVPSVGRCSV